MSIFSKKPVVWIVSDGTNTCVQSWAIARYITDKKHIIEYDILSARSSNKGFPDLAIGVGSGVADILEGIKENSKGKTKIAVILDPLKDHSLFDFIILPSYEPYHVDSENVISTIGLANYVNSDYLEKVKKEYKKSEKYAFLRNGKTMTKPFTTVLIGGYHTGGNVTEEDGEELASHINRIVGEKGGTALVTTSARTEFETARAVFQNLTVPNVIYDYKLRETENPYDVFLALADEIIVTGESVRMMCEACSTGKLVRIYKPKKVGFQYEPLIEELIAGNYAISIDTDKTNFSHATLNEALRVANIIKQAL